MNCLLMKKLFSLLVLIVIIAISNCTQIPENNDPILGTWSKTETQSEAKNSLTQKEEWIFNDAYLGRYHKYIGENLAFFTDFSWTITEGVYFITYNEEEVNDTAVLLNLEDQPQQLELVEGGVFAIRE